MGNIIILINGEKGERRIIIPNDNGFASARKQFKLKYYPYDDSTCSENMSLTSKHLKVYYKIKAKGKSNIDFNQAVTVSGSCKNDDAQLLKMNKHSITVFGIYKYGRGIDDKYTPKDVNIMLSPEQTPNHNNKKHKIHLSLTCEVVPR